MTPAVALLLPSLLSLLALFALGAGSAFAAEPPTGGIYSCVGPNGKRITSDREIVGCVGEQVERNRDGSLKRTVPRTLTEEEKAVAEEKQRRIEREATEKRIEQRKDEDLLRRYPDVAALERARQIALAPTLVAMRSSEERNQELLTVRKRLDLEKQFYPKGNYPAQLKSDLDRSDAALAAEKQAQQLRQDELKRNNDNFDATLERLKMLWTRQAGGVK